MHGNNKMSRFYLLGYKEHEKMNGQVLCEWTSFIIVDFQLVEVGFHIFEVNCSNIRKI